MAYESTSVPVERSQGELRKLLAKHGCGRFAFGEERDQFGQRWAAVSFTYGTHAVRMRVPLKLVDEREVRAKAQRAHRKTIDVIRDEAYEQEEKRIWRVLSWNLKARLVAVEEGVETFEEAFLAHLLDAPDGTHDLREPCRGRPHSACCAVVGADRGERAVVNRPRQLSTNCTPEQFIGAAGVEPAQCPRRARARSGAPGERA